MAFQGLSSRGHNLPFNQWTLGWMYVFDEYFAEDSAERAQIKCEGSVLFENIQSAIQKRKINDMMKLIIVYHR